VLVTGANGFLGKHTVARLRERGHQVRAMVRPAARLEALGWTDEIEVYRADLRVHRELTNAFDGVDALMHLAACVSGDEDVQFQSSVIGTERLLDAMSRTAARRVVFASSIVVYDWSRARGEVSEDDPLDPEIYARDGYDVAKLWQEHVVRRLARQHDWELTVLRPGFIWGPSNEYLYGIGRSVGPVHVVVGPLNRLPTTHVENCADCFTEALENAKAVGQTFNVVDGEGEVNWRYMWEWMRHTGSWGLPIPIPYLLGYATTQLAQRTSKLIFSGKGKLPGILVPKQFEAQFKPVRFSDRKLRDLLGWRPPLSFSECLERTYDRQR
jgi:UDP-glucose 4-epimerase